MRNALPRTSVVLAAALVLAATTGSLSIAAPPAGSAKLPVQQVLGSGAQASVTQTCPLSARLTVGVQAVVNRLLATGSAPLSLNLGQTSIVLACVDAADQDVATVATTAALSTSSPTPGANDDVNPY
jgi:hypothetical protein